MKTEKRAHRQADDKATEDKEKNNELTKKTNTQTIKKSNTQGHKQQKKSRDSFTASPGEILLPPPHTSFHNLVSAQ